MADAAVSSERARVILDIDGVLADVRHRLHHLQRRPKDWTGFFAAASRDEPLLEGTTFARTIAATHDVVYVTGRPEHLREATVAWLRQHELPAGDLVMRTEGDRRPATLVKVQLVRALARRQPVALVVDDDADVIAAMRTAGFKTHHATWMREHADDESTLFGIEQLHAAQENEGRT